jgi:chromosomal replication initiation ATPase DnaA
MVAKDKYRICGYIEYVASSVGFVTPVFSDEDDKLYVQVSSGNKHARREWELLPSEYRAFVISAEENKETKIDNSFLYGFKNGETLVFATGEDMSRYLSNSFLPIAKEGHELAKGFIEDWISLEPVLEDTTKESVWKSCLDFIGNRSKTMPGISFENFEVVEFSNGILTIRSRNKAVRKVFETKYLEDLVSYFRKEVPSFNINIIENTDAFPPMPFIYFGGGDAVYAQGSYFVETRIRPFQDFDNFIVSNFNVDAYHRALAFIDNKSAPILTISGTAGVGKTHLVNSIAKHFIENNRDKKIGIYTVFSQPNPNIEITRTEIEQFANTASDNDVIIIDDAHNINQELHSLQLFTKVLKRWKEMNKSIVLSFRDSFQIDVIPEFAKYTEQLVLTRPSEVDKLKIIESKINSYNIRLSGKHILALSEAHQIQNITDVQRYLARIYLAEELKTSKRNIFLSHHFSDQLNVQLIESFVYDYFRLNQKPSPLSFPETATLNAKVISHFIQALFMNSKPESRSNAEMAYIDGLYYSFDTMQYYLFESKPFRNTILEILRELIMSGNIDTK